MLHDAFGKFRAPPGFQFANYVIAQKEQSVCKNHIHKTQHKVFYFLGLWSLTYFLIDKRPPTAIPEIKERKRCCGNREITHHPRSYKKLSEVG